MPLKHLLAGLLAATCVAQASAAITLTVEESGPDLVLTGSGSANTAGLTFGSNGFTAGFVAFMGAVTGPVLTTGDIYNGITTAATTLPFTAIASPPTSSTGSTFGIRINPPGRPIDLVLPTGYVSGTSLSGSTTFANRSFSSMGMTAGSSYVWNWGSGVNADSLTLNIGTVSPVPEPGTWALMAAGLGVVAFAARRRQDRPTPTA